MHETGWQRARNAEQRFEREKAILEAAERLFAGMPYEKVTMQMIAHDTGLSQSNLYRYFASKEEVFLRLFVKDLEIWLSDVEANLGANLDIDGFVDSWSAILLRQERLLELHPRLALSLERNASEDIYRSTKLHFKSLIERGVPALKKALPFRDDGAILSFLEIHLVLTAGLYPMAQYSEMQERVLAEPALSGMKLDFASVYRKAIAAYLKGTITPPWLLTQGQGGL